MNEALPTSNPLSGKYPKYVIKWVWCYQFTSGNCMGKTPHKLRPSDPKGQGDAVSYPSHRVIQRPLQGLSGAWRVSWQSGLLLLFKWAWGGIIVGGLPPKDSFTSSQAPTSSCKRNNILILYDTVVPVKDHSSTFSPGLLQGQVG